MKENFTDKNENYQQVPDDRFNTIRFSEEKIAVLAVETGPAGTLAASIINKIELIKRSFILCLFSFF